MSDYTSNAAYERDLQDDEARVVTGVYGMMSKSFRKTFRNAKAQDKFFEHEDNVGNYEVHRIERKY